jgi:hypothetical protein
MALIMMEHLFTRIHWYRVPNRRRALHEVPATPPEKRSKKREKKLKRRKGGKNRRMNGSNALLVEPSGKYQRL